IAAALVRARVIRSATAFSVLARLQLASRQFHAGTYHLTRHMTISRVLQTLTGSGAATPTPAG
ncbi:MAG TPA: endolytic transglycosylase MltG, partial [Thermomicrobiaceae bacterium]|nr:endolytic transglycosylase MltG [Thermomicrobiaceae bacterium]